MRSKDCKAYYNRNPDFQFADKLFECGQQINYEWEQDFKAMKYAAKMIREHIEYLKTKDSYKTFGDHTADHALKALEERIKAFEVK